MTLALQMATLLIWTKHVSFLPTHFSFPFQRNVLPGKGRAQCFLQTSHSCPLLARKGRQSTFNNKKGAKYNEVQYFSIPLQNLFFNLGLYLGKWPTSLLASPFLADPSSDGWAGTTFPAPLVGDSCSVSEGGLELRFTQAFSFGGGAGITFRGCSGLGGLEVGDWQSSSLLGVSFSRDFSLSLLRASVRSKWEGQSIKKKKIY